MKNENKLIAEFMGLDIISLEQFLVGVQSTIARIKIDRKDYICPIADGYLEDDLKYHTSWDWLMPVIDKCYQEHMSKDIADAVMTCDIDKAYQVIVKFINQYNK